MLHRRQIVLRCFTSHPSLFLGLLHKCSSSRTHEAADLQVGFTWRGTGVPFATPGARCAPSYAPGTKSTKFGQRASPLPGEAEQGWPAAILHSAWLELGVSTITSCLPSILLPHVFGNRKIIIDYFVVRVRRLRAPLAGALASSSWHCSTVNFLGSWSFGILAFFFPSVMYGPNRPSSTLMPCSVKS